MSSNSKKWTVLSSKYLIQKDWCTVRIDSVQLKNGNVIPDYYVLEYPNWANVIAITKDNEFIFVYQYRHGLQETFYELPAGVCDDTDSSPLESAQRELLEETGYGNGKWEQLTVISANPGTHTNLCYCFLATDVEKIEAQHLEPTEDLDIKILTLDQVKQLLLNDQIKQSMHAAPLWKYMAMNKLM